MTNFNGQRAWCQSNATRRSTESQLSGEKLGRKNYLFSLLYIVSRLPEMTNSQYLLLLTRFIIIHVILWKTNKIQRKYEIGLILFVALVMQI